MQPFAAVHPLRFNRRVLFTRPILLRSAHRPLSSNSIYRAFPAFTASPFVPHAGGAQSAGQVASLVLVPRCSGRQRPGGCALPA
jgi:hypothetical protein